MINKLKYIKNHKGFTKYLKNTSWLFVGSISRMVAALFVGLWVARYLGPSNFGLLNYATSFVALFAGIATLGIDSIVVRNLVRDSKLKYRILGTAFTLKLVGSLIMVLVLLTVLFAMDSDFQTKSMIFIVALATIMQSFNVLDFYFQSQVKSKYVAYANLVALTVSSISKILLICFDAPLIYFAYMIVLDSFTLSLGFIYFYFHQKQFIRLWKFDKKIALSLLKDSWPLLLSGLAISIYMNIDQVMIKSMLGDSEVGQYAAATRLSTIWYFIPVIITSSIFPAIINAKKISEELYYSRLQKLYDLMVWMAIAIALPMTFLSGWIVTLLYGSEYDQAGGVLMIHVWASVFVFLGVASGKWFISENLQVLAFWRTCCGLLVNIAFNFILIPEYGIQGAATATLIGQSVAAYFYDYFGIKTRNTFWMKTKTVCPLILRGG